MSSPNSPNGERLKEVLEFCNEIDLKKVFWNKEDPVNYDRFISTAKQFDVIFTSDNRSIQRYVDDCGHENIYSMPFACQPVINPIGINYPLIQYVLQVLGMFANMVTENGKQGTSGCFEEVRHIFTTGSLEQMMQIDSHQITQDLSGGRCLMKNVVWHEAYKLFLNVNSVIILILCQ